MASQRVSGGSSGRRRAAPAKAKRRPAARRARPAARKGPSRIKWDKVGRVALTLVLAAVLYSYLNPVIDFVKTYSATGAAKVERAAQQAENTRLHRRIQSAGDPAVIDRKARVQGMVGPGETPVSIRGSLK